MSPPTRYEALSRDRYVERPAPLPIAGVVACVWTSELHADALKRVVPDGSADILSIDGGPPIVVGPATASHLVSMPAGTRVIGVRLRPGATSVLGARSDTLLDRRVLLDDLWAPALARSIAQAFADGESRGLDALTTTLASRPAPDTLVLACVRWLAAHPHARASDLSRWTGFSDRQLRRRVAEASGYAPKALMRVLRLQRLLTLDRLALAAAAHHAGYADQAHMSREVASLTGISPRALLAEPHGTPVMADFFKSLPEPSRKLGP
ncbi:MAG: AraC family transcriptional regulator [Sandaracinus sp.]